MVKVGLKTGYRMGDGDGDGSGTMDGRGRCLLYLFVKSPRLSVVTDVSIQVHTFISDSHEPSVNLQIDA